MVIQMALITVTMVEVHQPFNKMINKIPRDTRLWEFFISTIVFLLCYNPLQILMDEIKFLINLYPPDLSVCDRRATIK